MIKNNLLFLKKNNNIFSSNLKKANFHSSSIRRSDVSPLVELINNLNILNNLSLPLVPYSSDLQYLEAINQFVDSLQNSINSVSSMKESFP